MKGIAIVAAAAALLSLAGCNRATTTANTSANAAAGNSAAPKPADGTAANQTATQTANAGKLNSGGGAIPATSSGTVPLDRTYMLGRWTDDGDCSKAVEFTQDGHFVGADGSGGLWNLEGNQLTMTANRTLTLRIAPIDQNTMNVVNPDGSLGHSTRC